MSVSPPSYGAYGAGHTMSIGQNPKKLAFPPRLRGCGSVAREAAVSGWYSPTFFVRLAILLNDLCRWEERGGGRSQGCQLAAVACTATEGARGWASRKETQMSNKRFSARKSRDSAPENAAQVCRRAAACGIAYGYAGVCWKSSLGHADIPWG